MLFAGFETGFIPVLFNIMGSSGQKRWGSTELECMCGISANKHLLAIQTTDNDQRNKKFLGVYIVKLYLKKQGEMILKLILNFYHSSAVGHK